MVAMKLAGSREKAAVRLGLFLLAIAVLPWPCRVARGTGGATPEPGQTGGEGARLTSVKLQDPTGDDHGPGSYRYPIDSRLPPGSFDLTSLELRQEGEELEVEACFRVRPSPVPGIRISRYETASLLPQVIDIYVDTDGVPGSGLTRALPGRRVSLAPSFAWERALVVMPRAELFRTWLEPVDREAAARTHSTSRVKLRGRCLRAGFPRAALPRLQAGWGVLVLVSGARFYPTFQLGERLLGGERGSEFTRDVRPAPGSCVRDDDDTFDCPFGGCEPCGNHPRVLDALLCGAQEAALGGYDPGSGRLAALSGVRLAADGTGGCPPPPSGVQAGATERSGTPDPPPAGAGEGSGEGGGEGAAAGSGYRLADVADGLASIVGGPPRATGELGTVLDEAGQEVGKVVVTGQAGPVTLAQPIGSSEGLAAGMAVRF